MRASPRRLVISLMALACAGTSRAADEWPQFRGPEGNGHATAADLPVTWSDTENVAWKTPLPGNGHSSPVVSGNEIWLTTAVVSPLTEEEKKNRLAAVPNSQGLELAGSLSLRAVCVDRESGKVRRDIELFKVETPEPIHALNSYASPTPAIENGRLYCHFGSYGTACVETATGEVKWSNRTLKVDHQNGPGASPILWKDLLIAQYDGIDRQFVAGLSKQTGKVVWQTKRSGELPMKAEFQKAYATPHVVETDGQAVLISPGSDWVYGYDPITGQEQWRIRYGQLGFSTVPRPVVGHGMAYIVTSFMQSRLLAIRYDGTGDATESNVVWKSDRQVPKKPSLLLVGDELYMVNDAGVATCLNAKTGEEHWHERLGGQYSASPLFADGRVYACSQEGKTVVFAPGTEYRELAVNQLPSTIMASPIAVGNSLFVRTETHLYCLEEPRTK